MEEQLNGLQTQANINLESPAVSNAMLTNVAEVLSRSRLSLNHPSKVNFGEDMFSSTSNSELDTAMRSRFTGRMKISPTSMQFGGLSTFLIDPGAWFGKIYIYAQIPAQPRYAVLPSGWLYSLIDYVQFSCAGSSSISNLRISGRSMFDLLMCACETAEKRNDLLALAGDFKEYPLAAGTDPLDAAIPLHYLFASVNGKSSLGFDTGVLRSQIIFSIQWKNPDQVFWHLSGASSALNYGTAFSQLYMRVHNQVILENDLIAKACLSDPTYLYSVPFKYVQTFSTSYTLNASTDTMQFNLSSFPRGMLQCIIVSMVPQQFLGNSAQTNTGLAPNASYPISQLRLLYLGQAIYQVDTEREHELAQHMMDDDGNSKYRFQIYNSNATNLLNLTNYINIIPFVNRIDDVLRKQKQQVSPSYGGSQIQVQIVPSQLGIPTIDNTGALAYYTCSYPQTFNINFTYVFNALLETSNGVMSLQLD